MLPIYAIVILVIIYQNLLSCEISLWRALEPSSPFKSMFESINLPLSTLNKIKLEEVYAGYI